MSPAGRLRRARGGSLPAQRPQGRMTRPTLTIQPGRHRLCPSALKGEEAWETTHPEASSPRAPLAGRTDQLLALEFRSDAAKYRPEDRPSAHPDGLGQHPAHHGQAHRLAQPMGGLISHLSTYGLRGFRLWRSTTVNSNFRSAGSNSRCPLRQQKSMRACFRYRPHEARSATPFRPWCR